MDNNHNIEPRPDAEGIVLPDDLDVTASDLSVDIVDDGGVEAVPDASRVEVIGESGDVDDVADGASDEAEGVDGEAGSQAPEDAGKLSKLRGLTQVSVDGDWLKRAWRAHTLARVALLAVLVYAITSGSAYFFLMQPLSTKLHEVKAQKDLLHDYMVIEEASAVIGEFKSGLMSGDQRLTVMSEVNLMAEGAGVTLIGDPDLLLRRDVSGHFVEYPIRLRVEGTFHEMGEFLSLLERSPRFAILEDVEIRSEVASRSRESEATVLLSLAAWEG